MPFVLTDFPQAFLLPERISPASAWLYHVPFVPILVGLLRPRVIVELGTHAGDSYLAFCRAVKANGMQCACTAIDTWKGDAHTGHYGPEILETLRSAHDLEFSSFSRLFQSDFDAAAPTFADGSIDLLHIDGAHDYTTVRHDFDTWVPKLSDRAVVLFHDTTERSGSFGVWQVWDEVRRDKPHASIPYGHGLGVLAHGPDVPAPFIEFLNTLNTDPHLMKQLEALGHRIQMTCNNAVSANALHACQIIANEWRQLTGQAIRNQTPNMAAATYAPNVFANSVVNDVHRFGLDAVQLLKEVQATRAASAPSK